MIRFLLQVLPERLLERLGSAEEERLHRPLRAAERRGHVAVGEAVDTREEKGCALLRRQLADRRLELTGLLAGGCALVGGGGRGVGGVGAVAAVVVVPRLPEVDPEVPLGAPELVQAEVGGDGEEPGREAALGPIALAEAEDLHEDGLGHLLGAGLAPDQPARVLEDARAELLEEILEGRLVPRLEAEHQGHIGVGGGPSRDGRGRRRGPLAFSDRLPRPLHLTYAGRRHARRDSTRRDRGFPDEDALRHAAGNTRPAAELRVPGAFLAASMGGAKLLTARRGPLPAGTLARAPSRAHHRLPPGRGPAPDPPRADGSPPDPRRLHVAAHPGGPGALAAGDRPRPGHPGGRLAAHPGGPGGGRQRLRATHRRPRERGDLRHALPPYPP